MIPTQFDHCGLRLQKLPLVRGSTRAENALGICAQQYQVGHQVRMACSKGNGGGTAATHTKNHKFLRTVCFGNDFQFLGERIQVIGEVTGCRQAIAPHVKAH